MGPRRGHRRRWSAPARTSSGPRPARSARRARWSCSATSTASSSRAWPSASGWPTGSGRCGPTSCSATIPWRRYRLHPDHRHAGWLTVDGDRRRPRPVLLPRPGRGPPPARALLLFEADEPDHVEDVTRLRGRQDRGAARAPQPVRDHHGHRRRRHAANSSRPSATGSSSGCAAGENVGVDLRRGVQAHRRPLAQACIGHPLRSGSCRSGGIRPGIGLTVTPNRGRPWCRPRRPSGDRVRGGRSRGVVYGGRVVNSLDARGGMEAGVQPVHLGLAAHDVGRERGPGARSGAPTRPGPGSSWKKHRNWAYAAAWSL